MHLQKPHLSSGGRYPVLRALGILFLIGTGIALVGGLVFAGWLLASPDFSTRLDTRVVLAVTTIALVFFFILGLLAAAEVLKLLMDIEYNTRTAAFRLGTRGAPSESSIPAEGSPEGAVAHSHNGPELTAEETAEAALLRGH